MFDWIAKKINEFEEEGSLSTVWKVLFLAVALFLIGTAACQIASGQTYFRGDIQGKLEVWPQSERCYQHSMEATAKLEGRWEVVKASWEETFRWWGNCDSKIAESFTNAESGMAIGRRRDIKMLFGDYKNVWVGGRIYRNGIHHIWRNKEKADRYDGWVKGRWRQGVEDCQNNNPVQGELSCGSIAYWDRVGPTVVYDPDWGRFEATWLAYQWKDLTLPPNDAMFEGRVTLADHWTVGTKIEHSVVGNIYYTGRIIYNFTLRVPDVTTAVEGDKLFETDALSLGLRGGKLRTPGWRVDDPIEFAAVVLKIR